MSEQQEIIAVIPSAGFLIHGLVLTESLWHQIVAGQWVLRSRALCGLRGTDGWGGGGLRWNLGGIGRTSPFSMHKNEPREGYDGRTYNTVCPRCTSRARKIAEVDR